MEIQAAMHKGGHCPWGGLENTLIVGSHFSYAEHSTDLVPAAIFGCRADPDTGRSREVYTVPMKPRTPDMSASTSARGSLLARYKQIGRLSMMGQVLTPPKGAFSRAFERNLNRNTDITNTKVASLE